MRTVSSQSPKPTLRTGWTDVPASLATFVELGGAHSFSDVATHTQRRVSYADAYTAPARLQAAVVSANLWNTLGVSPILGRGFSESDNRAEGAHPVIIGHRVWRERYGSSPDVLSRTAIVDGVPRPIAGVMPESFRFPENEDVWLPLGIVLEREPRAFEQRDARAWRIAARLRPGIGIEQARAELNAIAAHAAVRHPQTNRNWSLSAVEITKESLIATGPFFGALQAGGLLLIFVMCGNLGNLLLARGEQRRRELAIRASLGASRARLIGLLMFEALLLSAIASALALVIAYWSMRLVPMAIPEAIPFFIRFRIDAFVVAFTILLTLITAGAAALGSAFRVPKGNSAAVLSSGATTLVGAAGAGRLRSTFLFVQTTVAAALLTSTLVVASGVLRLQQMDLGFNPSNTLLVELPLPLDSFGRRDAMTSFATRAVAHVSKLAGVTAAAASSPLPLAVPEGAAPVESDGAARNDVAAGAAVTVTPHYFQAAGIRVLRGRGFTPADRTGSEPVVVLNAAAVAQLFGASDPLGRRVRFGRTLDARPWRTVVGVVPNTVTQPLDPEIEPRLYVPYDQEPARLLTITVRASIAPESLARPVSAALREVDPWLAHEPPITGMRRLAIALWPIRFFNGFAGGLALFGVLVAAAGVYGLTRYLVLSRTREIGLRLALGAPPRAIVALIVRQSGLPVGAGLIAGLAASLAISNVLQHLVAGVSRFDPLALGIAAVSLTTAAGLAVGAPAFRAARIVPIDALRRE